MSDQLSEVMSEAMANKMSKVMLGSISEWMSEDLG